MNVKDCRIVFMGTPAFAVASLDALVKTGFNIVGVVTAPDKPAGRGMQMTESAVKKYAVANNLNILQPEKLKNEHFLTELKALQADLQIVVAFRMLPEVVWNMPPMGTVNVHGSLLPQYRGAAPINWAVINGDTETGVTTFKLLHAIDTGNILIQAKMPIGEDETVGEIHDKMMVLGADTLVQTVNGLLSQTITEKPQSLETDIVKHAPKIFTETCLINFSTTVQNVYNLIRGLSPYPAAFTYLQEKKLKIYTCKKEVVAHDYACGEYFTDQKTFLKYSCTNGFIHVLDLQLEGKKRMLIEDFLRGYRF